MDQDRLEQCWAVGGITVKKLDMYSQMLGFVMSSCFHNRKKGPLVGYSFKITEHWSIQSFNKQVK